MAPFGARGLNSGVADAENAAWRIAYALHGWADPGLVDEYDAERRAAAHENLAITTRTMDFLVPQTDEGWAHRRDVLERAVTDPAARARDRLGQALRAVPVRRRPAPGRRRGPSPTTSCGRQARREFLTVDRDDESGWFDRTATLRRLGRTRLGWGGGRAAVGWTHERHPRWAWRPTPSGSCGPTPWSGSRRCCRPRPRPQLLGLPADQRFAAEVDGSPRTPIPASTASTRSSWRCPGQGWSRAPASPGSASTPTTGAAACSPRCCGTTSSRCTRPPAPTSRAARERAGDLRPLRLRPRVPGAPGHALPRHDADGTGPRRRAGTVTTRMATVSDADTPQRMHDCHRAVVDTGAVVGAPEYYERVCQSFPEWLRDKEPWRVLFAQRDGSGHRVRDVPARREVGAGPAGRRARVFLVVGEPATRLALLRRLVDFDLVGSVQLRTVSTDDPVLAWAGGPRSTSGVETYDSLWVRLVDLPEALAARTWSAAVRRRRRGRRQVRAVERGQLADPRRRGRYGGRRADRRRGRPAAPGRGTRRGVPGGGNLVALARAGLVTEARPGAACELWRALRTDVAPAASMSQVRLPFRRRRERDFAPIWQGGGAKAAGGRGS